MANNYKIIDEKTWERAMHCMVFRMISGNPRQFNYRDESAGLCISAQYK